MTLTTALSGSFWNLQDAILPLAFAKKFLMIQEKKSMIHKKAPQVLGKPFYT